MPNTSPTSKNPEESHSYQALKTVLNSLDALVYVADMDTHEVLFFNDYGKSVWGPSANKKCYEVLQKGQNSPCEFCSNPKLLDSAGNSAGVYVWEFQNTQNGRWYQCRDQAIRWTDGRLVRMEIATDITERKAIEHELKLAKAKAEELADTDELTGIHNRRAFFNYGNKLIQQARRTGQPLAAIMFDIDHFKAVNDQWGHAAGDKALVTLTKAAARAIRTPDLFARLGGEEFVILLPNTLFEDAHKLAMRLKENIADLPIKAGNDQFYCTASFGLTCAQFPPHTPSFAQGSESLTLDVLLQRADEALLEAKKTGRNKVCEHLMS